MTNARLSEGHHGPRAGEARDAVQLLAKRGEDFIKVYAHLSRDSYFAIANEAQKQGLPFAGHVTPAVSATEAFDAGPRSIEHLNEGGLLLDCSSEEAELRKNSNQQRWLDTHGAGGCQALFERFRRKGTWQDRTVVPLRSWIPSGLCRACTLNPAGHVLA